MEMILFRKGVAHSVLFDDEDEALIRRYKWCLTDQLRVKSVAKKGEKSILMHRLILGISDRTIQIDHKKGNPLNNYRSNLRVCTTRQNACNRQKLNANAKSKYKGVIIKSYKNKSDGKIFGPYIAAAIRLPDGKKKHLGRFKTEEQAAHAYDAAARIYHNEFATYNFPGQGERSAI